MLVVSVLFYSCFPTLWSLELLHWCCSTLALQTSCCSLCFQLFPPPCTCVVMRSQRGYIRVQTITFRSQPEDFCCGCCCSLCLLCLPASRCSASSYFFYLWIIGFLWQPDSISPPGNWAEPWTHSCVVAVELIFASYVCILLRVCVRGKFAQAL